MKAGVETISWGNVKEMSDEWDLVGQVFRVWD